MPRDNRQAITDPLLKGLVKRPPSERTEIMDASRPAFGIRVNARGGVTFFVIARFGDSKHPTRRVIGSYGPETKSDEDVYTLADAAALAERWRRLAPKGKDPKLEKERHQRAAKRQAALKFEIVAEDFITAQVLQTRKGKEVARDIRRHFISRWRSRPAAEIERTDVIEAIEEIRDSSGKYQAFNALGYVRRLFSWSIGVGKYGLETSPCDRIKPRDLLGEKQSRRRVLSEPELRAYWNAAGSMAYPYGPILQLLTLTGQRKSEIAEARWSEINMDKRLLVIPPERMKSDAGHVVPLTEPAIQILRNLPRFSGKHAEGFIFSTSFGEKPVNGFSKCKARLDAAMLKLLGPADSEAKLPPFVLHDVRRTVRSGLSALPIEQHVRELIIGHTQQGLHKVYDLYAYADEKRRGLDLWAARLSQIVAPPPANVVSLAEARQSA